jgi:hypothetical protein
MNHIASLYKFNSTSATAQKIEIMQPGARLGFPNPVTAVRCTRFHPQRAGHFVPCLLPPLAVKTKPPAMRAVVDSQRLHCHNSRHQWNLGKKLYHGECSLFNPNQKNTRA